MIVFSIRHMADQLDKRLDEVYLERNWENSGADLTSDGFQWNVVGGEKGALIILTAPNSESQTSQ